MAALLLLSPGLRAGLGVGDRLPALREMGLEGDLPATNDRVLLVDFWASWCSPCHASFPALAKLHELYAPRGVVVIGVSVDKRAADYGRFLKKYAPPFATVRDAAQQLVAAVDVPAMPSTLVVGRDGVIRTVLAGYHGETTDRQLRAALDAALAEKDSQ